MAKPKRKRKRTALRESKQQEIAEAYLAGQKLPPAERPGYGAIALLYNVSEAQVQYAVRQLRNGELGRSAAQKERAAALARDMEGEALTSILNRMVRRTAAELETADLSAEKKASAIQRLCSSCERLIAQSVEAQVRGGDARKVVQLARALKPGITEREVVVLWKNL